jgi:DNA-binding GntR family transcriptional regulator
VAHYDALAEFWFEPLDADDPPRSDRIRRSNLSRQIAERLRNDIVHGRIEAGTHLIQDEICERFGTSRIPVRDALQQLTHEGLLIQQGQQRVVVSLGGEELEEVHSLIALLHGWAAGQAAIKASDDELDELAAVCQDAVETEDRYEFGHLAMQFHRKINLLAHSSRLIRTLVGFRQIVPRTVPFSIPEQMKPSKERHIAILNAIRSRDPELAERLTRSHSMIGVELLVRSLKQQVSGL